ncbi:hypothetical protein MMC32_000213 [Xylographa parallela]|nr:hypothetical protein [Xylographa parallela]
MRSIQPSKTLECYLFFSTLLDIARTRTLWAIQEGRMAAILFSTIFGLRCLLLLLESAGKRRLLKPMYQDSALESTSNMISRGLFWWLNPQLLKGYSSLMSMADLSAIDTKLTGKGAGEDGLQQRWNISKNRGNGNSLLRACLGHFKWQIGAGIIPRALQIGFLFAQPFLIRTTIALMSAPDSLYTTYIGYALIGSYAIVYVGIAISTVLARHKAFRVITMMRDSIVSMIYDKTMKLPSTGLDGNGPITLMSADIERLASGLRYMHDAWASTIEICIALYLLYKELGIAGIAPIVIAMACAIFAVILSAMSRNRQKIWLEAIEARVDATSRMLGSMKGVKMRGLTTKLFSIIQGMKEDEIKKSQKFRELLIAAAAVAYSNGAIAPVISFAIYSVGGSGVLTTEKAFYALTLFALLNEPIGTLVEALTGLATARGSLDRIDKFLKRDPHVDGRASAPSINGSDSEAATDTTHEAESIELKRSNFNGQTLPTLSFSEKTHVILDSQAMSNDMAYGIESVTEIVTARHRTAGWVKNSVPVLQNLNFDVQPSTFTVVLGPTGSGKSTLLTALLGEVPKYDGYLYVSTPHVAYCAQVPWLTNTTLKQNILGESLFDLNWYRKVIRACGLEQDFSMLTSGDHCLVGSNGSTLSGGQKQRVALARAVYSRKLTVVLDDPLSGLDPSTEEWVISHLFGSGGLFRETGATVIMASNSVQHLSIADHVVVLGTNGRITQQGSFEELNAVEGYVQSLSLEKQEPSAILKHDIETVPLIMPDAFINLPPADGDRRTGDMSLYTYYIQTVGIPQSIFFVGLLSLYVFFLSFPAIWVQWWAAANDVNPNHKLGMYLGVYACLAAGAMISVVISCWHLMVNIVSKAARVLHTRLLSSVLNAPMSFFTTTDLGITTNRFTQDLQLIDMELPISLLNTVLASLTCLAQLIIISYSTRYLAAIVPLCLGVFYMIQRFYLRTSRQLRFMEIEIKSPLFSNFLETLSGLVTIRAFGWEDAYRRRNLELVKTSQKPFYLLFCVQRWLELVVSLAVAGFAVLLVGVAVATRGSISAGFIGVALINIVTFSENIQSLIMHWTVLETSLGAVSRIRSFTSTTESENLPSENTTPPSDWPSTGEIQFRGVSASYTKDTSRPALKDISISIAGGQKVGICGRSGSGKSTFVATLLRMLDLDSGSIWVDDIDLSTVPRQEVRSRMIVMPQDPYFFGGSVRLNLDPPSELSDDVIIKALNKTQIWDTIQKQGGLDAMVTDDFLSHGQRQLLCLSGAILHEGKKIFILDEATSGVDKASDELMQRLIRSEFQDHTVIAIAHRLDTILDFDQVIVMDKGIVSEIGNPMTLLRDGKSNGEPSQFALLYESLDHSMVSSMMPLSPKGGKRKTVLYATPGPSSRRTSVTRSILSNRMSWFLEDDGDEEKNDRWSGLWRDFYF